MLQQSKEKGQGPTIPLENKHSNFLPGGPLSPSPPLITLGWGPSFSALSLLGTLMLMTLTVGASLLLREQGFSKWTTVAVSHSSSISQ